MSTQDCPPVIPPSNIGGVETRQIATESPASLARPRTIGKNKTVIDSENFQVFPERMYRQGPTPFTEERRAGEISQEWIDYGKSGYDGTKIEDRFRFESRCFWTTFEFGSSRTSESLRYPLRYIDNNIFNATSAGTKNRFAFNLQTDEVETGITGPEKWYPSGDYIPDILKDFCTKQQFKIIRRLENFRNVTTQFKTYVEGGEIEGFYFEPLFDKTKTFFDHCHITNVPFFPKELEKVNNINNPAIVSIDSEYNFRISKYEQSISSITNGVSNNDVLLPNMYVFLFDKKRENLGLDTSIFKSHLTLGGLLPNETIDSHEGQYFDNWGRAFSAGSDDFRPIAQLLSKYRLLFLSPNDIELFNNYNDKRFLFPMYVDLQFSTDRETFIADAIRESQLTIALMKAASLSVDSSLWGAFPWTKHKARNKRFTTATEILSTVGAPRKQVRIIRNRQKKILDIAAWWERFKDLEWYQLDNETDERSVIMSTSLPEVFISENSQYNFARAIMSLVFSGKLRQILKDRIRTFEEIMTGKPAYSETLFYKISKYQEDANGSIRGRPIQEIFVPNSSELNIFRYIDTQVAFGKQYRYVVYAYDLVLGTEYQYKVPDGQDDFMDGFASARVEVFMKPSIQLVENPLVSTRTSVTDRPPMPPDVDIIPYKNVNNEILFNFNSVIGEMTAMPIAFTPEDVQAIAKIRQNRGLSANSPIEFKTDDLLDYIEIYRTTFRPTRYSDFANFFHNSVESDLNASARDDFNQDSSTFKLSATSIVDELRPNVKYYYTFRAVDIRGNKSNPTPVYLVEMVSRDGVAYPRVKIVDMKPVMPEKSTKQMKKYIKIAPSVIQTEPNFSNMEESSTAADLNLSLGNVEDSLFAKHPQKNKIKVRLTSKETGKKIDVNLNFTHKHNR